MFNILEFFGFWFFQAYRTSLLSKEQAIPSLTIHGDLNDLRCYSEEQAKKNIEAFVEQLEER